MSVFLGGALAGSVTTVLQANDARVQPANYQFDFSGKGSDLRPWLDGLLWSRSRMGGSDSSGILLGNDFQSTGRYENDLQDILGGSQVKKIIGFTQDAAGNPAGSCIVQGFLTATDQFVGQMTSDSAGYFELPTSFTGAHYLVCYKAGSPDIAGTSVNTIVPV